LIAAATLSGCGVSNITASMGSGGIFGPGKENSAWTASVSEASLLHAAKSEGGPVDLANPEQEGCPPFSTSNVDRYVTIYEPGHNGDSLSVMYRGEVTKTSRECELSPDGGVTVKYGFAGRVLLGPKGRSGPVSLPVTFVVLDKARNKIKSEALKIQVEVSSDQPVGYFSVVRLVTFRINDNNPAALYTLNVTFDQKAPGTR
jgi:hypothetical protein